MPGARKHTGFSRMSGFLRLETLILQRVCSAVVGARKAAKEVCTMTALPYRTTNVRASQQWLRQNEQPTKGPQKYVSKISFL